MYRGLAVMGIKPRDADGLEVWEAAALLGLNEPDEESDDAPPEGREAGGVRWTKMPGEARRNRLEEIRRKMSTGER